MIEASDDARTVNNVVRHQYRVLTDQEKQQMLEIKDLGAEFIRKLHEIGGTDPTGPGPLAGRGLSIAQTKAQEAVMWAVWHITG